MSKCLACLAVLQIAVLQILIEREIMQHLASHATLCAAAC